MVNVYEGSPSGGKSKAGLIKPLIGLAILGGAALVGYSWYTANKCDTLGASNRTINGVVTAGCCKPFPMEGVAIFNTWSAGSCTGAYPGAQAPRGDIVMEADGTYSYQGY